VQILIGGVFLLVNCGVLIATGLSHDKTLPRKVGGYFRLLLLCFPPLLDARRASPSMPSLGPRAPSLGFRV